MNIHSGSMLNEILIATNNSGKVRELSDMLEELPISLIKLSAFPGIEDIEESGNTFAENACLKASGYAVKTGKYALADDSGLEVAVLGGRPGVYSARYGGEGSSFGEKMQTLLCEIAKRDAANRQASFVCTIALASPAGEIMFLAEGICKGTIADEPRGIGGFGYDPLFIPDGFDRTFGELDESIKRSISHRARAFRQIIPFLRHFQAV